MKKEVISDDLRKFMILNKVSTIETLLAIENEDYYTMIGFSYHILVEMLDLKRKKSDG